MQKYCNHKFLLDGVMRCPFLVAKTLRIDCFCLFYCPWRWFCVVTQAFRPGTVTAIIFLGNCCLFAILPKIINLPGWGFAVIMKTAAPGRGLAIAHRSGWTLCQPLIEVRQQLNFLVRDSVRASRYFPISKLLLFVGRPTQNVTKRRTFNTMSSVSFLWFKAGRPTKNCYYYCF